MSSCLLSTSYHLNAALIACTCQLIKTWLSIETRLALPPGGWHVCVSQMEVTWRKSMLSCVWASFSRSLFLLCSVVMSCLSRVSALAAWAARVFSLSLIESLTSALLFSREWISSTKIMSLTSTAACANPYREWEYSQTWALFQYPLYYLAMVRACILSGMLVWEWEPTCHILFSRQHPSCLVNNFMSSSRLYFGT